MRYGIDESEENELDISTENRVVRETCSENVGDSELGDLEDTFDDTDRVEELPF